MSVYVNRYQWVKAVHQVASGSTTPPADVAIAHRAAANTANTYGVFVPEFAVLMRVGVSCRLATTGGSPSMTPKIWGWKRSLPELVGSTVLGAGSPYAAEGTADDMTSAGKDSTVGRWTFIKALNAGNAIDPTANPECVPRSGQLVFEDTIDIGGGWERLIILPWAMAGTAAKFDAWIGFTGTMGDD